MIGLNSNDYWLFFIFIYYLFYFIYFIIIIYFKLTHVSKKLSSFLLSFIFIHQLFIGFNIIFSLTLTIKSKNVIIWLFSSSLGHYNIWLLFSKQSRNLVMLYKSPALLCKVIFFLNGFFNSKKEIPFFFFINCSFLFFSPYGIDLNFSFIFRKRSTVFIDFLDEWSFGSSNLPAFDLFFAHPRLPAETELSSPSTYISAIFSIYLRFSYSCHWRFYLILWIEDF